MSRPRLTAVILAAVALVAAAATGRDPTARAEAPPAPAVLPGNWHTFANGDDVLSLAGAPGVVWAGTRAGGLVRWETASGQYTQFLAPQTPLAGNTVYDLAVDATGLLWAATNGGMSALDDNGTAAPGDDIWRTYIRANTYGGLPSDDVRALALDGNTVWVAGVQEWDSATDEWRGGGLGRLDTKGTSETSDDVWMSPATFETTRRSAPDGTVTLGLVSDNILDMQLTPDGIWIGTSAHWRLERTADPTGPRTWQQVHGGMSHLDFKGTFATDDDSWTAYSCENPLTDSDGRPVVACTMATLDLDLGGRIWAAAGGMGVVVFPGNRPVLTPGVVFRFQAADGLGGNFVDDIDAGSATDTVWFATRDAGVRTLAHGPALRDKRDDVWRQFDEGEGMPRRRTQAIMVTTTAPQRVWVGTGPQAGVGGGVVTFLATSDEVETTLVTAAPAGRAPASNFVTDLTVGPAGSPWAGQVVAALGSRTQRTFGAGLQILTPGDPPLGTGDHIDVYTATGTDDNGTAPFTGLAGDNVHTVMIDGSRLWTGSASVVWDGVARRYVDGGLAVLEGGEWTARTADNTGGMVAADGVSALGRGCDGAVWMGSGSEWGKGRGVSMLTSPSSHLLVQDSWAQAEFPELASNEVEDIASCRDGAVWVASRYHNLGGGWSDGGLARYEAASGTWSRHDETSGYDSFAGGRIKGVGMAVASGPGGDAWAGAFGAKEMSESSLVGMAPYWPATVNRWHDSQWQATMFAGLGTAGSIEVLDSGAVWAGVTRGGAARDSIDPVNWKDDRSLPGILVWTQANGWKSVYARSGGLPGSDVSTLAAGPGGTVWVGTEGWGLSRYDPRAIAPTPTPTSDAPSPTPTRTPTATLTPIVSPSATGTGPTPTPTSTRSSTPGDRNSYSFLPIVFQR